MDGYTELHSMHNRKQRSLIPIIDMGLSYLFGIATQADLSTIWVNVDTLAKIKRK